MPNETEAVLEEPTRRDPMHILLMGLSGAGKTTLCSTFEKPELVFLFDPPGQERAYINRGKATGIKKSDHGYYREVYSTTTGKLIIRIEYWGESNPFKPSAYPRFVSRTANLEGEIEKEGWKTVVADTATFFELSARYYSENSFQKDVKHGQQHYAFSTHACEQHLMTRWPNLLLCNSIVCCHFDDQKDEAEDGSGVVTKKMVALPGKLPNRIPGGFGEVWRVYYAGADKEGKAVYLLQTQRRPSNSYACKSAMGVKDGIIPHFDAIWKSLEGAN